MRTEDLWNGSGKPPPERLPLRAGPLALLFESGELRYLKLDDRELVRRIYSAVRDRNWGTVPPRVSNLRTAIRDDSFDIAFDVECRERQIDFFWRGEVRGEPDGTIRFSLEGEARSTFFRNRIGFCVLHPILECPGARARVVRPDGSVLEGTFPRAIAPTAPFPEMVSISHEVAPGLWVEVRFEGETFEMEDQRNWLDGSFKTFCTSLRHPYPVEVPRGTRISQSVTVKLRGPPPRARGGARAPSEVLCELGEGRGRPLPAMGLGTASHGRPLEPQEIELLRALRLSHLRVDLSLSSPTFPEGLERASTEARALGAKLEAALFLEEDPERELERLALVVREVRPPVLTWLVFHRREKSTTARWARLARERLSGLVPGARFGGGTDNDFAEVNRGRPPLDALDLVSFAFNPQVHGFDDSTLVESLEAHRQALESLRSFSGDLPLAVSPVTFRPRFLVNATGPVPQPAPGEIPFQVDPRQMSLFGAAWTLASIGNFAHAGASSLTYHETTGWRGVMETRAGSPLPEKFRSLPGSVFPLYHVIADLGEHAGGRLAPVRSSVPEEVAALGLEGSDRRSLLLSNLTPETREVKLCGLEGTVHLRRLDETTARRAMTEPLAFRQCPGEPAGADGKTVRLQVLPYSVVRIDQAGMP